jgi:VanZ family protein
VIQAPRSKAEEQLAYGRLLCNLGILTWIVALYFLSENSAPQTGPEFPFKDKLLHCIYFSGGAFCFAFSWLATRKAEARWPSALLLGFAFAAITGALDEWHQSFTPGRMGNDVGDWLADAAGGLIGGWLAGRCVQALRRPSGARSPM